MKLFAGGISLVVAVILTAITGYVLNIVKLVGMLDTALTAEIVLRIVGCVVPPIGVIMGLFV